jgi:1-acyl-sn-glycerol-3-phosphate acyltransferase
MFPEGTTGDGRALLPFHANLLQAAVATHTPVQPLALRYVDADSQPSRAVAWVGDTTLVSSLWTVATAHRMQAFVTQLPVVPTTGQDRRALSDLVRSQIASALGLDATTPAPH